MITIDLARIEGQLLALAVGLAIVHIPLKAACIPWHCLLVVIRIQCGNRRLCRKVSHTLPDTCLAAVRRRSARAMSRVQHAFTIGQRDKRIGLRIAEMRLLLLLLLSLLKVSLSCGGDCQSLRLPVVAGDGLCWSRGRKRGLRLTIVADGRDNWLQLLLLLVVVAVDQQRILQHRRVQLLPLMWLMVWQVLLLLLLWHVVRLMRRVHHGRLVHLQLVGASMWAQGLHNESVGGQLLRLLWMRRRQVEWYLRARIMILLCLAAAEQQCQLNVCTINQSIKRPED